MRRLTPLVLACAIAALAAPAAHAADPCANAALRTGAGANLPDCRAWEQVSPVDKNGNNANPFGTVATSPDGNRAYFNGSGDLGGADSQPFGGAYVARRSDSWLTTPIDPPLDSAPFVNSIPTFALTPDLTKALSVTTRKLTADAVEGASNVYIRDTATRAVTLAFTVPGGALSRELLGFGGSDRFYALSPDGRHFAFRSQQQLTADAPQGPDSLYQWDAGSGLKLASRLPGEAPAANGLAASVPVPEFAHGISDDGSRTTLSLIDDFFQAAIYQRVGGSSTRLISRSDRSGDDPTVSVSGNSPFTNPAGTQITFAGQGPLTDASDPNTGLGLYRWDDDGTANGRITDLLAGRGVAGVAPSIEALQFASPDGRYVWFTSAAALTLGSTDQNRQLFVLDTVADTLRRAANLDAPAPIQDAPFRFSPDGSHVALRAYSQLTGYDNANPDCDEPTAYATDICAEVFTYDASQPSAAVRCVSCGTPGRPPAGSASIGLNPSSFGGINASPVTNSGRVYFDTPERLDSADVNALRDVYEYVPGRGTRLMSSGTGSRPATFAQASPSGDDVFFYTFDPLVGQDTDTLGDLYTARVGGGIAAQQSAPAQPRPCEGGGCRGEQPAGAAPPRPGSVTFVGPPRPPVFRVGKPSSSALRAAARTGRVTLSVKVGAAGKVAARLRAKLSGRTRSAAYASAVAKGPGTIKLNLRLSSAARRELARNGSLRLSLTVAYSRRASIGSTITLHTSRGGDR